MQCKQVATSGSNLQQIEQNNLMVNPALNGSNDTNDPTNLNKLPRLFDRLNGKDSFRSNKPIFRIGSDLLQYNLIRLKHKIHYQTHLSTTTLLCFYIYNSHVRTLHNWLV